MSWEEISKWADALPSPVGTAYYSADHLYPPASGAPAGLAPDPVDSDLSLIFDSAAQNARGLDVFPPAGAGSVVLTFFHRATSSPGGVTTVDLEIKGATAGGSFSAAATPSLDIPNTTDLQEEAISLSLAAVNLTAGLPGKLQIDRAAPDSLSTDWGLRGVVVSYL